MFLVVVMVCCDHEIEVKVMSRETASGNTGLFLLTLARYALCTIWTHSTELIMLGCKLHSGISKTKEFIPVQPDSTLF